MIRHLVLLAAFSVLMARRRAEEALQESESRLRGLVESAPMAIVAIDGEDRITLASEETEVLFGYLRDELIGQPVEMLLPEGLREGHVRQRIAYHSDPEARAMGCGRDLLGRRKDGTAFPIEISLSSVNMTGGALSIAFIADITERKRMEEELREQARRDSLTGVLNHGAIIDELRRAIAAADDDAPCAVAMADVDGLKAINDTYGHQIGDAVIIKVAGALSKRGAVVGRYGGDEFLAVLPCAGRVEAERYRGEVVAALADASVTESETGASVPVAASIGLAVYPEDGVTIDEIVDLS
ncbi:MAG: GGDEF domain-containing protein, partial [Chloroflexi bacterium]|nr:GGDEF domain-containing protein [Chloroflexota bacterium]